MRRCGIPLLASGCERPLKRAPSTRAQKTTTTTTAAAAGMETAKWRIESRPQFSVPRFGDWKKHIERAGIGGWLATLDLQGPAITLPMLQCDDKGGGADKKLHIYIDLLTQSPVCSPGTGENATMYADAKEGRQHSHTGKAV
jgi:hypothetical protein